MPAFKQVLLFILAAQLGSACAKKNATAPKQENTFIHTGNVSGLEGVLILMTAMKEELIITKNGPFQFRALSHAIKKENISVTDPPLTQECLVKAGESMQSSIVIDCHARKYSLKGKAVGLNGKVILESLGKESLEVTAEGDFSFKEKIPRGGEYKVRIKSQPEGQTCTVINPFKRNLNSDIDDIQIICSRRSYTVSGKVEGLYAGSVLRMQNNYDETLEITNSGEFSFRNPLAENSRYEISILDVKPFQICSVESPSGLVKQNISNVRISCHLMLGE